MKITDKQNGFGWDYILDQGYVKKDGMVIYHGSDIDEFVRLSKTVFPNSK